MILRTSLFAAPLAALCLGGCASYTDRTAEAYQAFRSGRFERAAELYSDADRTDSEFLAGAESGTVALAAGDWAGAREAFERAAERVREHEERALVSAESAAEQLGGFLLNESQLPYVGEGYERVLLHASLALTYLADGDVEGLRVETRRSNRLLESEEALYETEYGAGGLAHFLSALGYELYDELDDALIDYRRMVEKGTGGELAARAALRVAERLGRIDEFPELVERFGEPAPLPEGTASIVLIAGLGSAPVKEESSLTVPTPWGIARFAVPSFENTGPAPASLTLRLPHAGLAVDSSAVEDVDRVMRENLDDRLAWLGARTAARAAARMVARKQVDDQVGIVGALAVDVFTLVAERADLRGWTTLPAAFHAARAFVPAGVHAVEVSGGGDFVDLGEFELEPGETLIVLAREVGPRLYAYPIGGRRVQDEAYEPLEPLEPLETSEPDKLPPEPEAEAPAPSLDEVPAEPLEDDAP